MIGFYPIKAVYLHYYFAKLYICSQVFRGLSHDDDNDPLPTEFRDTAQNALDSAKSIIQLTTQDPDLTKAFTGVPHYFHTMISYACAFLLKTFIKHRSHVNADVENIQQEIAKVIELCETSESCSHNLSQSIGRGLRVLLSACTGYPGDSLMSHGQVPDGTAPDQALFAHNPYSSFDSVGDSNPDNIWNAALQATSRLPTLYTSEPSEQFSFANNGIQSTDQQYMGIQGGPGDFYSNGASLDGLFGLGLDLL